MSTYISTSEYMFQAAVMFNKRLSQLTVQEREQIKAKVLERRAARPQLVTDLMRQKYGRDGWS
jgi:hypothetical protein